MQFFWKHLHNNKGDENVSKLIWIVIAFVIGALLLSTMSVAFRTDGTGTISGWLNSSLENWFGEADGRDGSVGGGAGGSGGGLHGGGPNEGGGNEATSLEGIVMSYDATIGALTSDNEKDGKNYTTFFSVAGATEYDVASYSSDTGESKGPCLFDTTAEAIAVENLSSEIASNFANGTFVLYNADAAIYIGVDEAGNVICPLESSPVDEGKYVIFDAGYDVPIVLAWKNGTLMSSGKDYSAMFSTESLKEGLLYAVTAYPSESDGSNVDETDSVLGVEYAVAEPAIDPYDTSTMMLVASNGVTTGVDTSGNILIMNAARPSTDNAVYSQGTDGFENVEQEVVHSGTIPTNGFYYIGVTTDTIGDYSGITPLTEGQAFPVPSVGDIYVYGDYEYRYNMGWWDEWMTFTDISDEKKGANLYSEGWGVRVIDDSAISYDKMISEIANRPVDMLAWAFKNCENLLSAPEISENAKYMSSTFEGCNMLKNMPVMPDSVVIMENSFEGCSRLTEVTELPSNVIDVSNAFEDCSSLVVFDVKVPESVTDVGYMFKNCSSLEIAPEIPAGVRAGKELFKNCTAIKGVITIYAASFTYFDWLSSITNNIIIRVPTESNTYSTLINSLDSNYPNITVETF